MSFAAVRPDYRIPAAAVTNVIARVLSVCNGRKAASRCRLPAGSGARAACAGLVEPFGGLGAQFCVVSDVAASRVIRFPLSGCPGSGAA